MSSIKNSSSRRLVAAAGLHTDEAVFDYVNATNPVFAPKSKAPLDEMEHKVRQTLDE